MHNEFYTHVNMSCVHMHVCVCVCVCVCVSSHTVSTCNSIYMYMHPCTYMYCMIHCTLYV